MNDIYTWPNDLYPLVKKRFELRYDERMDLISQLAGIVEQAEVDYRLEGVGISFTERFGKSKRIRQFPYSILGVFSIVFKNILTIFDIPHVQQFLLRSLLHHGG